MRSVVKVRDKSSPTPVEGVGSDARGSSSTPSMQPTKEVGRVGVSRDNSASAGDNGRGTTLGAPAGKRQRTGTSATLDKTPPHSSSTEVDMDVGDHDAAAPNRVDPLNDDLQVAPSPTQPKPVASTSSLATSPTSKPSAVATLNAADYVPLYVRHDTLLSRAGIDNRRDDALQVQLCTDARYPMCPVIDRLQYQHNDAARQRFVADFLGGKNGLHINAPTIDARLPG
jgi:hypothetical protein